MKNVKIVLVSLLAVLLLCGAASAEGTEATGGICVSGTGIVHVDPDYATVSLGVMKTEDDVLTAQSAANKSIDKVRKALLKAGVAEEDISVSDLSVYARYDYSTDVETITGYTASHQLDVHLRDIDNAGEIIDAALKAGANQLNGITFGVEDSNEAYAQALQLAVANAQAKAAILAQAAGTALGKIEAVKEETGYSDAYMYKADGTMGAGDAASTTVDTGTIDVTATVTITYAIEG